MVDKEHKRDEGSATEVDAAEAPRVASNPAGEPDGRDAPQVTSPGRDGAAGAGSDGEAPDAAVEEAPSLQHLQDDINALNDRHLRLAAEFDNYRKRVDRERAELRVRSQAELIARLLEPLDDLQRVIESGSGPAAEPVVEGVRLVEKKLRQALEAAGLQTIEAEGQPFDPESMEALLMVPTDDPAEDHHVADVFQKGYRFNGQLVRPARVRVKKYEDASR